jgi:pre-mRNA-splicing factor CWC22
LIRDIFSSLSSVRDGHRNHKRQHARSASSASDTSSASSSRSRSRSSSRSRSRSRSRERKKSPRRERRRSSRSHSPKIPRVFDVDPVRKRERERQLMQQYNEEEPEKTPPPPVDPAEERIRLAFTTRTGGAYIPPAKLREMQAQITDKSSREYQRLEWERLKKSINGLVNKVNTSNIKAIVPELFKVNLIRGRGLFARSIMKAQAAALPFTPVYAALIAVLNARMPQIGELVLSRLVVQFRRAYKRNDKVG